MQKELNEILSFSDSEILNNESLLLRFLRIYSNLYLNKSQPRWCSKCHAKYLQELRKTGFMKTELMEQIKNRTLIPNFKGIMYTAKIGHINSETITDDQATDLLNRKILPERLFIKLPDSYLNQNTKPEIFEETLTKVARKIYTKKNK